MSINRSNIKLQVTRGNKMKMKKRKAGGSFPDVTGDNKTTMKDVLVKRGVLEKKGDKFVVAKKQNGGSLTDDIKKIKKRKGGGMAYQLYGGSTKDFSNGNKFIQSFYDKGGK